MRRRLSRVDPGLAAIVAEGFLSRLSFGLISFGLPLYAYREFGLGLTEVGLLLSFNLAVAALLKPVLGAVADRVGMRPSFLTAIGLRSVVSLLLAVAAAPWQLFAIRGVHGFSVALRDPSAAVMIADLGGKRRVASAFAWYQTAKSVAGAIGKASAGILLSLTASNFSVLFGIAFVLSALPVVVVARYVKPSAGNEPLARERAAEAARGPIGADVPVEQPGAAATSPPGTGDPAGTDERGPRVLSFAGLGFLVSGTAYMLANLFPIFAVEYAGLTEAQTGLIYGVSILVVLSGPGFGWLSDHVSRKLVLSLRSAANILSSAIYLVAPSFAGVLAGRAVDDAGKAAFKPAWGALMAQVAGYDRRKRARTMGSMSAGEDAGEIAGPIVAGLLWSLWGVPALLAVRMAAAAVTEVYAYALLRRLETAPERADRALPELRPGPGALSLEGLVLRAESGPLTATVPAGAVAVYAANGAEAGALAAVLCGEREPVAGRVILDGQDLRRVSPESGRAAVSRLDLASPPRDAAIQDVLARHGAGAAPEELARAWAVCGLTRRLGCVETAAGWRVGDLPVADRCLVALAASLVGDPAVLVLDESGAEPPPETAAALESVLASHGGAVVVVNATAGRAAAADLVLRGQSSGERTPVAAGG